MGWELDRCIYSLTQKIPPTTQVGKIPLAAHTYGYTLQ